MLSSSKGDGKQEARFAARLDVLMERMDTLAATVATTASAIAKKDGEIAALQHALEARDQTLQALVQHANRATQAPTADAPVDATELRSLRNAVAALTKERANGVNAAHIEGLVTTVRALAERVDALTAAVAAPSTPAPDPAVAARVDAIAAELETLRTAAERPADELVAMLSTLRGTVDGLAARLDEHERARDGDERRLERRFTDSRDALAKVSHRLEAIAGELERTRSADEESLERRFRETEQALAALARRVDGVHGVDEDVLRRRFEERDDALVKLAERLDTLAETVESATASLGDKERELASLEQHVTESHARIESIVDDVREALHAFPEPSATAIGDLAARLERLEAASRKTNETSARAAGELSARIDSIDERVATVADEVSRAKTLWPVALRSLEARLEDVTHAHRPDPPAEPVPGSPSAEVPDDLLAGLRDSLQAMESVAAEMARASETLSEELDAAPGDGSEAGPAGPQGLPSEPAAAAAGATIVPLRAGEP